MSLTVSKPLENDYVEELQEWISALENVVDYAGPDRARLLLTAVADRAREMAVALPEEAIETAYVNTLKPSQSACLPQSDRSAFEALLAALRWNAAIMVLKAGRRFPELGGHIATYASIAVLYEVGLNYFFRGRTDAYLGDLVYFQGHSSPGIYARAFLEGRLSAKQLEHFRQEVGGEGLSSYPHPWLMPDFWQFPTVSMGLGPFQAIYQARFMKYLHNRGLLADSDRKVWVFCGDGEMDEPESVGALTLPAREQLDNLIFVINCNLQRLDGPVRGNTSIIQELESLFRGARWYVIKVIWGSLWDDLLAQDTAGVLKERMRACVDGEFQSYVARGAAYFREQFFGQDKRLQQLIAGCSDDYLEALLRDRGGLDPDKVYAAYQAAVRHQGQPVVILAKTIKGYGMGSAGESMNVAHQRKKMSADDLKVFRDRFAIPVTDKKIDELALYRPKRNSPEMLYLRRQRDALGGYVPKRSKQAPTLKVPPLSAFDSQIQGSGDREISTTMSFVRLLSLLLRDKALKPRIVPIVPDESRTFGMEGLFRQLAIYAPMGQLYHPEDKEQLMHYHEAKDGQFLQEGINEAGAFCSWLAAATAYSTHQLPMIPFYIYYSMFGFQRIGDFAWAAADMRARGFLLGATSGRTTLSGEGLQHQDGQNHLLSSLIPNCVSYDPTYAYELAVIIQHGLQRMLEQQEDVYYYITLMNENYTHPAMPKGAETGIIKGMYRLKPYVDHSKKRPKVRLLGCGAILREALKASELLEVKEGVSVEVWSVTSFTELRREALVVERYNQRHAKVKPRVSYVQSCLSDQSIPVIAVSDYVRLFADQIRAFVLAPYYTLGTDGFGRSGTRQQLRDFFEVDAHTLVYTAAYAVFKQGLLSSEALERIRKRYGILLNKPDPTTA